jgi:uncharacterized protein YchJ
MKIKAESLGLKGWIEQTSFGLESMFRPDYNNYVSCRTEPKIGRNNPCPCGSGVKYKKCCLNKGVKNGYSKKI